MMRSSSRSMLAILTLGVLLASGGCVERTMKIRTDPEGAIIIVNDEEVGVSPVRFSFVWYGDYEIIVRKPGYETLQTHHRVEAPWWQWPPFDLVAETMVPTMIRDDHELPVLQLQRPHPPDAEELVQRAAELQNRAVFEGE